MRVPHAARALRDQLGQRYKKVEMTGVGEGDGFGVQRTVEFDKTSSRLLKKVLPHLDDPRIADYSVSKAGIASVTFVGTIQADSRDPYPLEAAETVADAEGKGGEESDSGSGDA